MKVADEPTDRAGSVIVCGLQSLGIRIVEQLHRTGTPVVVIDDDPDRRLVPVLEQWRVPFVLGSPRSATVLVEAGIGSAVAAICVEDDDLSAGACQQLRGGFAHVPATTYNESALAVEFEQVHLRLLPFSLPCASISLDTS